MHADQLYFVSLMLQSLSSHQIHKKCVYLHKLKSTQNKTKQPSSLQQHTILCIEAYLGSPIRIVLSLLQTMSSLAFGGNWAKKPILAMKKHPLM